MGPDLNGISEETLAEIKKAQTNGITASTGITGVDLSGLVSLVPVNTPFRDMLFRSAPEQGNTVAEWKALLNVNNKQPNPFVAFDAAAALAVIDELDVFAPYAPLGMGYTVFEDAIYLAKGYADAKAIAIFNALNQWKIGEDKAAIGAQAFALAQPAAPTLAEATTGGSIAPSTPVYVGVAARTGGNYFWGGNSQGHSANLTTSTVAGSTHQVTATVPAVPGAVAYDWFVSANGTTWFYYTTTTVATVTVTSVVTANQAVPTSLPDLSSTVPTFNSAADNGSAGANQFNGLLATVTGDYGTNSIVTHGTGTASGATIIDNAGAALTLSGGGISQLDTLLLDIYNTIRLSPDALMLSSQEANNISSKVLGTNSATTFLETTADGRTEVAASGFVGTYVNRAAAGARVRLEVHPHLPPGTIVARTDRVPFPNSNIARVHEIRCLKDVSEYVYGSDRTSGGPREDGEVRALETYINRAPVACGVIQNIANG